MCIRDRQSDVTVSVAIALGSHLFPFRTQKLSPVAPMVLGTSVPGRVGRRRFRTEIEPPNWAALFSFHGDVWSEARNSCSERSERRWLLLVLLRIPNTTINRSCRRWRRPFGGASSRSAPTANVSQGDIHRTATTKGGHHVWPPLHSAPVVYFVR